MKPYLSMPFSTNSTKYNLGISTKNAIIDQKRNMIELFPGYQTSVSVIPQLLKTEDDFEFVSIPRRKCKFSFETDGLPLKTIVKEYTRVGCELECAAEKAAFLCNCMPWYYSNNNYTKTPICDMFGGHCFESIMSNGKYYKMCPTVCLQDCEGISMAAVTTHKKINTDEFCKDGSFLDQFLESSWRQLFPFEHYNVLIKGGVDTNDTKENKKEIRNLKTNVEFLKSQFNIEEVKNLPNIKNLANIEETDVRRKLKDMVSTNVEWRQSLCKEFVEKYVALVSVESPTPTVAFAMLDVRDSFFERLGTIGGTLGLFTSSLFMVDWLMKLVAFLVSVITNSFKDNGKEDNDLDETKNLSRCPSVEEILSARKRTPQIKLQTPSKKSYEIESGITNEHSKKDMVGQ